MNEHDELQQLLGTADDAETKEGKFGTPWIKHSRDIGQWVIEPNSSYAATSSTVKELPPGMYKLSVDDRGVIHFRMVPILTDKIIDLHDPASDEIINGIRKFWESEPAFQKIGMLYKRGILLWGPAGSGKTVTVTILMRELVTAGGVVLFCEDPGVVVGALEELRKIENVRRLIVVLEDIEEIIEKYGEHTILALLDGEHQVGNVVNIATTNYPERLGARIINRPSRFDQVKKIGMPNAQAREAYFEATIPEKPFPYMYEWVRDTDGMSIAHLRELVVAIFCLEEDYNYTIERLKKMSFKKSSSQEFGREVGMAPSKPNGKANFTQPTVVPEGVIRYPGPISSEARKLLDKLAKIHKVKLPEDENG